MGFSETLNLFLRAYKESVNPVTYQVLCFSITMNCVYNIGEGGNLIVNNCTMVCLFTLIPYPEVNLDLLSRIEDQTLNVHFLTDSNLGPTCQAFFCSFFFSMKISKSSNVCSKTTKLFAEEYCVCDTLHMDNTKLRLCSE